MMSNDEIDLIILLNYTWHLDDKTINIPVVAGEPQVSHHNIQIRIKINMENSLYFLSGKYM